MLYHKNCFIGKVKQPSMCLIMPPVSSSLSFEELFKEFNWVVEGNAE